MNKKTFFIILAVILFSLVIYSFNPKNQFKDIYTDENKICAEYDSYSFYNRTGTTNNKKNHLEISYKGFDGMQTIWIIQAQKPCKIEMDFDSEVKRGKFKTVLISPEKRVITMFEQTKKGTRSEDLSKGEYRIKIVGQNAKGHISMTILNNDSMRLTRGDEN